MTTELRWTIRRLARRWTQALAVVMLLGVGGGVTTTIVGLADGVLFRPLPYQRPHDLLQLESYSLGSTRSGAIAREDYDSLAQLSGAFEGLGLAGASARVVYQTGAVRTDVNVARVTPNLFQLLGVRASLGRLFEPEDTNRADDVVLLTWATWKKRFEGSAAVLGQTVLLDGRPLQIVGVLSREFVFPSAVAADAEFVRVRRLSEAARPGELVSTPIVRLQRGLPHADAQHLVDTFLHTAPGPSRVRLTPLSYSLFSFPPAILWALIAAAACMMAGVCANVMALLAPTHEDRRDFELQVALGCSRPRLIRRQLLETTLLASGSAIVGVSAAAFAADWMLGALPDAYVNLVPPAVPLRIVVIGLLLSAAAGLICGGGTTMRTLWTYGRQRYRAAPSRANRRAAGTSLVACEAAIAVLVLTAGSALLGEVVLLKVSDIGYDPRDSYALTFSLRPVRGTDVDRRRQELLARVRAEPRVQAAGLVDVLPMGGGVSPAPSLLIGQHQLSRWETTAGFLPAIGARFRAGRDFTDDEGTMNEGVVIVNAAAATALWPGQLALGQTVVASGERPLIVVGVVDNLRAGYGTVAEPAVYVPLRKPRDLHSILVLKGGLTSREVATRVGQILTDIDHQAILSRSDTVVGALNRGIETITFPAVIVSLIAGIAWFVALCGIGGLTHGWIESELRNIAVRMAIGAGPRQIRGLAWRKLLGPVAIGAAFGTLAVLALGPGVERYLVGQAETRVLEALVTTAALLLLAAAVVEVVLRRKTTMEPASLLKGGR